MNENNKKLAVIDGETLLDIRLVPTKFCVETLLPGGLCILGGAPKIGKSWMVLDLCVHVAKGEDVWNLHTNQGTVLYLCLEDSHQRIKNRLNTVTDEATSNLFFATEALTMDSGLCNQIREFYREHPDTVLVAIDTFQLIRNSVFDTSYSNDYQDMQTLKKLADELHITILLVHHLRKMGDSDPLNRLSGTTGIIGAADAVFVLDKSSRNANKATLFCTGRDIESREIELEFNSELCVWAVENDSLFAPEIMLPHEMQQFIDFSKHIVNFEGSNTELAESFNTYSGLNISPKTLKQMMNRYQHELEKNEIFFESHRSNGKRYVLVYVLSVYNNNGDSDASASSDAGNCECICV